MERAILTNAHLDHAVFGEAHLEGANLGGAHLEETNFSTTHGLTRDQIRSAYEGGRGAILPHYLRNTEVPATDPLPPDNG
jgi:hypothetical protein